VLAFARTCQQALDRVALWAGFLAGALFFGLAFFITYDVLARKWGDAVGLPTSRVTDELSGYILVLAATWGLAYTLRTDSHVRIDVLLPYMPARLRAVADVLAQIVMAGFAALFTWRIWILIEDSWETGIRSSTYLLMPLWLPQAILGVGFGLLALAAIASAVVDLVVLVSSGVANEAPARSTMPDATTEPMKAAEP
jgi:TRAP-type mannitol/chloroaromatic compound transport system permease small subunit